VAIAGDEVLGEWPENHGVNGKHGERADATVEMALHTLQ
jgi:hypothetical protein